MARLLGGLALVGALCTAEAIIERTAEYGFLKPSSSKRAPREGRRFLSVADLHGDYQHASDLLQSLSVMDERGNWIGGGDVLVQTGDVCDRGDHSKQIYEMLFRLQDQAEVAGGEVILLLGNHELLSMQGDTRYASDADVSEFGGSVARDAAFAPGGWLGKRLRERGQIAALLGPDYGLAKPTLYVHAGLLPSVLKSLNGGAPPSEIIDRTQTPGSDLRDRLGAITVDITVKLTGGGPGGRTPGFELVRSLNSAARLHLIDKTKETLSEDPTELFGQLGPLWTRHLALDNDACGDLQQTLAMLGAARMVVGHTAQDDGLIHSRCDGQFVLADTKISEAYDGTSHPSALEIMADGVATALYPMRGQREKPTTGQRKKLPITRQ